MKSIQIIKTPSVHFTRKTIKTFTNIAITKFMMISLVKIILFNQKKNECTINMSSHNSEPNHYEEWILLSQYENSYCFYLTYYEIHATKQVDMEVFLDYLQR